MPNTKKFIYHSGIFFSIYIFPNKKNRIFILK